MRLTAAQRATNLRGIAAARAALHAGRDPFPAVTARHDVDQALATTKAVR